MRQSDQNCNHIDGMIILLIQKKTVRFFDLLMNRGEKRMQRINLCSKGQLRCRK